MTDLLDLAARLEAACDITGKPIGRHMIATTNAVSEIFGKDTGREAQDMATVTGTLSDCIDAEAKLFDALEIVAKEAVEALRAAAKPIDLKGMAELMGTTEEDVTVSTAWHAGYDAGSKSHAAYSAGYTDAERDVAEYLDDVKYRMSRCEHRSSETRALLHPSVREEEQ
ncbi:hypothetical protein [Sphingomonas sp. VDB2]|uniref:hypothetical protein n=1 Tax=Sphingomonas sp. VDB2 TaxID=3228751 RepID=UPI003A810DCA